MPRHWCQSFGVRSAHSHFEPLGLQCIHRESSAQTVVNGNGRIGSRVEDREKAPLVDTVLTAASFIEGRGVHV
jgi:hypothetical protein